MIPNFSYVTHLLSAFADGGNADDKLLIARMTLPCDVGGLEIKLIGGMVIQPATQTGIKPFTVYATSSYGSKTGRIKRYDCIQTAYEGVEEAPHELNIYDEVINYPFSQVHHNYLCLYVSLCFPLKHLCLLMFFSLCVMFAYVFFIMRYVCLCFIRSGIGYSSHY